MRGSDAYGESSNDKPLSSRRQFASALRNILVHWTQFDDKFIDVLPVHTWAHGSGTHRRYFTAISNLSYSIGLAPCA